MVLIRIWPNSLNSFSAFERFFFLLSKCFHGKYTELCSYQTIDVSSTPKYAYVNILPVFEVLCFRRICRVYRCIVLNDEYRRSQMFRHMTQKKNRTYFVIVVWHFGHLAFRSLCMPCATRKTPLQMHVFNWLGVLLRYVSLIYQFL